MTSRGRDRGEDTQKKTKISQNVREGTLVKSRQRTLFLPFSRPTPIFNKIKLKIIIKRGGNGSMEVKQRGTAKTCCRENAPAPRERRYAVGRKYIIIWT